MDMRRQTVSKLARWTRHETHLGVGLGTLLLGDDLTADDKLADVVRLVEVEEAADLGRALGAEALGEDLVRQAGDVLLPLLDDDEVEGADVGADDAAANRLALALTRAAGAVARVALREEEADTVRDKDSLLERESLLLYTPESVHPSTHEAIARVCVGFERGRVEEVKGTRRERAKGREGEHAGQDTGEHSKTAENAGIGAGGRTSLPPVILKT